MPGTHERASRAIALLLRHRPDALASGLDTSGWASIDEVVAALVVLGHAVDRSILIAILESDPVRYERVGDRVRARHGHSVEVALDHPISTPPDALFHGTVARAIASIREHGLVRGQRLAVHLSSTREGALRVGGRRGSPLCIVVAARAAHDEGIVFRKVDDGTVWLVETVPPRFLTLPEVSPAVRDAPRSSRGRG